MAKCPWQTKPTRAADDIFPGHRLLLILINNILEINQYFSFSKNIDFCIDFAIGFGIDSETAKFDQIFDQIWPDFDQI